MLAVLAILVLDPTAAILASLAALVVLLAGCLRAFGQSPPTIARAAPGDDAEAPAAADAGARPFETSTTLTMTVL